ncbi:MAG: hypothetical protein [Enterobacter phage ENC19]|nr:MAG: hypothetical protein [Enterobacter phage ENC19]
MSHVDFNTLSQLGLIWKINKDILHPLGLALTRDPETGVSIGALVSDDGVWSFSEKSDFENIAKLNKLYALQAEGKLLEFLQQNAKE